MRLEHTALNVEDAPATAAWWVEHLGLQIVRADASPPYMTFLTDGQGSMIELYTNPKAPVPNYAAMHPLELHLAFEVEGDIEEAHQSLLKGGAEAFDEVVTTPLGDQLTFIRDPWGVPLQLVKRAKRMDSGQP